MIGAVYKYEYTQLDVIGSVMVWNGLKIDEEKLLFIFMQPDD